MSSDEANDPLRFEQRNIFGGGRTLLVTKLFRLVERSTSLASMVMVVMIDLTRGKLPTHFIIRTIRILRAHAIDAFRSGS